MKILIIDDHALFLAGIRHVLQQLDEDLIVLEALRGAAALDIANEQSDIDLVLMDLQMPDEHGFTTLDHFTEQFPTLPVVVVSASENPRHMRIALDKGALGYIPKSSKPSVMLTALNLVLSGGMYIPPAMVHASSYQQTFVADDELPAFKNAFTPRQEEVLKLLIAGCSNKKIATKLGVAEGTVRAHVAALFKALKVSNRTQAVLAVEKMGINFA